MAAACGVVSLRGEPAARVSCKKSALDGNAGERYNSDAANGLSEDTCRLKDAEEQKILDLCPGDSIIWTGDDFVVVDPACFVDVGLNDNRVRAGIDCADAGPDVFAGVALPRPLSPCFDTD